MGRWKSSCGWTMKCWSSGPSKATYRLRLAWLRRPARPACTARHTQQQQQQQQQHREAEAHLLHSMVLADSCYHLLTTENTTAV
jgi:hypothetical protein